MVTVKLHPAFLLVLHDLMVSKLEVHDIANFVRCRGGARAIPLPVVSTSVTYVFSFPFFLSFFFLVAGSAIRSHRLRYSTINIKDYKPNVILSPPDPKVPISSTDIHIPVQLSHSTPGEGGRGGGPGPPYGRVWSQSAE